VLLMALILAACSKEEENRQIDLGYNYFPITIGHFIEYEVDSIAYDLEGEHDTAHYFVREVIESEIIDALDEPALRIERFKKDSLEHTWELADIWSAKRTSNNAQRIEEDKRYIRLVFPLTSSAQWDGNALNSEDEWTHNYSEIVGQNSYGDLSFSNTVTVLQRDFKSLIDDQYAYEVYASEVGLIEKYFKVLETNTNYTIDPVGENILGGVEFHFKIIDFGEVE